DLVQFGAVVGKCMPHAVDVTASVGCEDVGQSASAVGKVVIGIAPGFCPDSGPLHEQATKSVVGEISGYAVVGLDSDGLFDPTDVIEPIVTCARWRGDECDQIGAVLIVVVPDVGATTGDGVDSTQFVVRVCMGKRSTCAIGQHLGVAATDPITRPGGGATFRIHHAQKSSSPIVGPLPIDSALSTAAGGQVVP